MRTQYTLISAIRDKNNHTYTVTIGTDIGQFTGEVFCRPEDWERESRYFGLELAELKANILYARAKKNHYAAQIKALNEFYNNMRTTRTYNANAFWVKKLQEQIDDLVLTLKWWKNRIQYLKEAYHIKITTFDSLRNIRKRCEEYNND